MSDIDTYTVYTAVYDDLDVAESDYEAVVQMHKDLEITDFVDAAVLERKSNDDVKIRKHYESAVHREGWEGAGIGLAVGLVAALFPAVALTGGLVAGTTVAGGALGAITGHVTRGISRGDLKDLGEALDAGSAGVVVVAGADQAAAVERAVSRASNVLRKAYKDS